MGCSPSKGKLFTGASSPQQNALLAPCESSDNGISITQSSKQCVVDKSAADYGSGKDVVEDHVISQGKRSSLGEVIFDTTSVIDESIPKTDVNSLIHEKLSLEEQQPQGKPPREKGERKKKTKGGKKVRSKDKVKKNSLIQAKIELPEDMVKAHQAAYAYLNPNITKYETLLGLLDQAAQTQLSLQPMVTIVAMRYDEINQTLEEMAKEGEKMLEEHGDHMAWPTALMKTPLVPGAKPGGEDQGSHGPPPPDLLQQLLQHSTEKMRLVGESVTGLGDSALEEAREYFASLSGLLGEKLKLKRAAESRLKQVLARVEAAAVRKLGVEDSALHSEDSGIGGENESLTGSERQRQHRESCASSGVPSATHSILLPHGEDEEDDDDDEEDDDEEELEDEAVVREQDTVVSTDRRFSNSSLPAHNQKPNLKLSKQNLSKEQKLSTRPKTADITQLQHRSGQVRGPRRTRSMDNLYWQNENSLVEPNMNLKDLTHRQERIGRDVESVQESAGVWQKAKLRRHSLGGQRIEQGPIRASGQSTTFPMMAPVPPGRHAVKRLITTFSNGVEDKPSIPPHVKINRKCRFPMINAQTSFDGPSNKNHGVHSRHSDRHDELDVDSLPPPPPEVLMDDSFEFTKGSLGQGDEGGNRSGSSTACQKTSVSQKLRASVQSMAVLPNRGSIHQGSLSLSPACPTKTDAVEDQLDDADAEKDQTETLYQQARKIINLRDAACTTAKRCQDGTWSASAPPAGLGSRQGSSDHGGDGDTLSPQANACPPTTPPVSRTRLPPSCPSVCHTIPAPPSYPSGGQWRAPSPPTSRWTRENSNSDGNIPVLTSVAFASARSVFCQDQTTRTPSCTSTLPRPWGEASRGRLPMNRGIQGFQRRSSSEQRATNCSHQTEQPLTTSKDPMPPVQSWRPTD